MGIGIKYDDGSGSLKPLASFRGMAGTPPIKGGIGTLFRGMAGTPPIRKSLSERMRERRELGKEASKSIKLDVADPRRQGKVVGAVAHHELDADDSHRGPTEHTPWQRPFMSGIHFEREAPTGRIIVWSYLRTDKFTGEGRAFETTGETKVPVFSFYEGDGIGSDVSCYRLELDEKGKLAGFANRYFMCGGIVYRGPNAAPRAGIAALSIPCQGDSDPSGATIEFYSSFDMLKAAQSDLTKYTIPLYEFSSEDSGDISVVADFRNMPSASMGEYGL